MGMYDNLRLEAPLPDPEYQDRSFQTKSLECSLSDYTITRDGRLVLREVEYEATPEEEMPYYGTEEWEPMQTKTVKIFRNLDDLACFVVSDEYRRIADQLGLHSRSPVVWIGRLFMLDNDYGEDWFDNWHLREQLEPEAARRGLAEEGTAQPRQECRRVSQHQLSGGCKPRSTATFSAWALRTIPRRYMPIRVSSWPRSSAVSMPSRWRTGRSLSFVCWTLSS